MKAPLFSADAVECSSVWGLHKDGTSGKKSYFTFLP